MKMLIFAGGGGTRFWPLSREQLPKQFVKFKDGNSTLQLTAKRVKPTCDWADIYISTNEKYIKLIKEQLPKIPSRNIFTEPARRDVGPAVGLSLVRLRKLGVKETVFIFWADHLIKKEDDFRKNLKEAEKTITEGKYKFLMWSEKPVFANNAVGWTNFVKSRSKIKQFKGHDYRPEQKVTDKYFKSGNWYYNTGYSVSSVDYMLSIYEKHFPNMYADLVKIEKSLGTKKEKSVLNKVYPNIEKRSFDEVVLYNLPKKDVGVVTSNMGWEDPGTLFALKKSLEPSDKNYVKGEGILHESTDSLIYNTEKKKIVIGSNLKEVVIVNTEDVVYVTDKEGIAKVKEVLEILKQEKKTQKHL